MIEGLLTRTEAAKLLSVSTQTVSRLIKGGRLVAVRVGKRHVRVTAASVEAYIIGKAVEAN